MYVLTGLAHNEKSKVAYESDINQRSMAARSRKLATIQKTLSPPQVMGKDSGDLLVVGWGSTKGAIEEAVCRMQKEGKAVSSTHLRFLSPMEPGLKDLFNRFSQVVTVEINYSDDPDDGYFDEENRRYAQLAMLLRAKTLVDVKSWSRVPGYPLQPGIIYDALNRYL
jgi:2-oxoglutarate ferredoxin oxidoreductase subunit alpha